MEKFISDDDKLKGEIEKMISINALEAMREIFPEESKLEREEAMQIGEEKGIIDIARNMKELGDNFEEISKRTGLSLKEIEQI